MLLRMFSILLFVFLVQHPLPQQRETNIERRAIQKPIPPDCSRYSKIIEQLNNKIDDLIKKVDQLNKKNEAISQENVRLNRENIELKRKAEAIDPNPRNLTDKIESLRNENERLSASNADLRAKLQQPDRTIESLRREIAQLNMTINSLRAENGRILPLRNENTQLGRELAVLSAQNGVLHRRVRELEARLGIQAEESNTTEQAGNELRGKMESAFDQLEREPQAILASVKSTLEKDEQDRALMALVSEENGKVRIIRDLVIGKLEITYDKEVIPGRSFPLNAEFKPNPILLLRKYPGITEEDIKWHIELDYQPLAVTALYEPEKNSGKPLRRYLDPLGNKETWEWVVTAPMDFQKDKSKVNILSGYTWGAENRSVPIDTQFVEYVEKRAPGFFALAFGFLKENLTFLLGMLTALIGIYATLTTIKKSKVETALNELKLQAETRGKAGGQTA